MKKALLLSLAFAFTGSIFSSETEAPDKLILDFKIASTESNEFWSSIVKIIKNSIDNPDTITKESSIELVRDICIKAEETKENEKGSININMFTTSDSAEIDKEVQPEHSAIIRFVVIKTDNCSDELWVTATEKAQQLIANTQELANGNITIADFITSHLNEFKEMIELSDNQLTGGVHFSLTE